MALGGDKIVIKAELQVDESKAIAQVQNSLKGMTANVANFNKNPIISKNFTQPLGRITGAADEFTKSLEASNARVLAFGASAGAIFAVQRAMQELVKTTITVEQKLTDINALLNVSDKQFKRFSDGLFQVARQTGTAFAEVADSANEFARQGLSVEDTLKRTNAALALSKLGMMDSVNATESLTAALNTFKGEVADSEVVVNKLAQVDAKFAVSSKDLAEAIKRTGSSATGAKVSFEELLAVVTVTQERTARGGAVIGNAFKTIFTRIQRPEVLNQLAGIGVEVRKQSGEVLPAIDILRSYAKAYDGLAPSVKSNTAQLIAGGRQINILQSLLPDLASATSQFDAALRVANDTTTEATDRLKILTSTTQGTLNAVQANLTKTASEIGSLTIKPAIDNILKGLDQITTLVGPSNFFGLGEIVGKGVYEGIGKVISGPGLLLLGTVLAKLGGNLLKFVTTSGAQFLGLNKAAEKQAHFQTIITNLLARQPDIIRDVNSGQTSLNAATQGFNNELIEAEIHYKNLKTLAEQVASQMVVIQGVNKGGVSKKKSPLATGLIPNFVPNFAMADAEAERQAASQGGYRAGQIRRMNMPGMGGVTYNGKEDVKKFPGMEQPAIMPPALSSAGKNYRKQFKSVIGFDPYNEGAAFGFVPNFSTKGLGKKTHYDFLSTSEKKNLDSRSGPDQRAFWAGLPQERKDELMIRSGGKTVGQAKGQEKALRAAAAKGGDVDVQQKLGILSLLGTSQKNAETSTSLGKLSVFNDILNDKKALNTKERKILSNAPVTFRNVQVSSLTDSSDSIAKDKNHPRFKNFKKSLNQNIVPLVSSLSSATFGNLLGNQRATEAEIMTQLKGVDIIPESTEGELFETAARFATRDTAAFKKAVSGDLNAPFDFEEGGNAATVFKNAFFGSQDGFNPAALVRADAKRTASAGSIRSVINKSFNRQVANMAQKTKAEVLDDLGLPFLGGNISVLSDKGARVSYTGKRGLNNPIAENKKKAALGLVPNFSLKGVSDAMKREDRSGVRRDKIRVGYDRRLAASGGIGVYNTDEGSLGNAINMHMAAGRNKSQIQRQGKADGHVPNFATRLGKELRKKGIQVGRGEMQPGVLQAAGLTSAGSGGGFSAAAPLKEIAVAAKTASSSIGAFGGTLKVLNQNMYPVSQAASTVSRDIGAFGSKARQATVAKKEEIKEIKKSTQGQSRASDMSIGLSLALTTAGGVISSFSRHMKESDSKLMSFSGHILDATAQMAMFAPSLIMINEMLGDGGIRGAAGKAGGFLSRDISSFSPGGTIKSGLGRLGGLVGGGALAGAALGGVGIAGALAYGQYKKGVDKAQKATDALAASMEKSAKAYDDQIQAFDKLVELSKEYVTQTGMGNSVRAKGAQNEMVRILARSDVLEKLDAKGKNSTQLLAKLMAGNTTAMEEFTKTLRIERELKIFGESMAKAVDSIRTIKSKDMAAGLLGQESAVNAFSDVITNLSPTALANVGGAIGETRTFAQAFRGKRMEEVGGADYIEGRGALAFMASLLPKGLDVAGQKGAEIGTEFLIRGLRDVLKKAKVTEAELAAFDTAVKNMFVGMDDEGAKLTFTIELIEKLNKAYEASISGNKKLSAAQAINNRQIRNFSNSIKSLEIIFTDTARELKLKKDLSDILQSGADKMFKQASDSLKSDLGKISGSATSLRVQSLSQNATLERQRRKSQSDIDAKFSQDVLGAVQQAFGLKGGKESKDPTFMGLTVMQESTGVLLQAMQPLIDSAGKTQSEVATAIIDSQNNINRILNNPTTDAERTLQTTLKQQSGEGTAKVAFDNLVKQLEPLIQGVSDEEEKARALLRQQIEVERQRFELAKKSLSLQERINSTMAIAANPRKFLSALRTQNAEIGLAGLTGDPGRAQEARIAAARELAKFRLSDPSGGPGFNPADQLFTKDLAKGFEKSLKSQFNALGVTGVGQDLIQQMALETAKSITRPDETMEALTATVGDLDESIKTIYNTQLGDNTKALRDLAAAIRTEMSNDTYGSNIPSVGLDKDGIPIGAGDGADTGIKNKYLYTPPTPRVDPLERNLRNNNNKYPNGHPMRAGDGEDVPPTMQEHGRQTVGRFLTDMGHYRHGDVTPLSPEMQLDKLNEAGRNMIPNPPEKVLSRIKISKKNVDIKQGKTQEEMARRAKQAEEATQIKTRVEYSRQLNETIKQIRERRGAEETGTALRPDFIGDRADVKVSNDTVAGINYPNIRQMNVDAVKMGTQSVFKNLMDSTVAGYVKEQDETLRLLLSGEGIDFESTFGKQSEQIRQALEENLLRNPSRDFEEITRDFVVGVNQAEAGFKTLDDAIRTATASGINNTAASKARDLADKEQSLLQHQLRDGTISLSTYTAQLSTSMAKAGQQIKFLTSQQNLKNAQDQFNANLLDQTDLLTTAQEKLSESYSKSTDFAEALNDAIGVRFQYNTATYRRQSGELVLGLVDDFKSGTKEAFGSAIRGTESLREAFSNVFDSLLDKTLDKSLDMGVDAVFGAVGSSFGLKKGGRVKGYNAGGFVNQGSGVRDDVPAMMQGGEYVIRKSSVNKYGRGMFDALNSGGRVGYAMGDRIMQNRLRPEFVYNDPKRPTSGSFINTEGLSAFAMMESGSPMIGIQQERQKALESYIRDKAAYDEMVRKAQDQFKKQQKARMKSTLISVGLQAATFGLSTLAQGAAGAGTPHSDPNMTGHDVLGDPMGGNTTSHRGVGIDPGPTMNDAELMKYLGIHGSANGGLIKAFARGGRNRDNIPALLMGGEYVVNKRSVDKYGVGLFNDLNNGRAQGFANGGMVGGDVGGVGGAPTTANNNFEINISMTGGGEGETTTTSNQNENQSQEQQERNEQLGLAVKNAVQTELIEQQRPGGLLYREDRI